MKRCSQCHFTFTDDQQFCDFDHTELTLLPEHQPTFPKAPVGQFRRIARSPLGLTILAVSGIAASALLIGYFDSLSNSGMDVASNSVSKDQTTLPRQSALPKPEQALIRPATKVRSISTQRQLTANETSSMPSSILKWEPTDSSAPSKASAPDQQSKKRPRTVRSRQNLALRQSPIKRRVPSNATRTRRQASKSDNATYARNHGDTREQNSSTRREQTSRDGKGSKVIAILKKTGSFLTKPFRL